MKTGTRTQVPHDYNWPLPLIRYGWMIIVKLLFLIPNCRKKTTIMPEQQCLTWCLPHMVSDTS